MGSGIPRFYGTIENIFWGPNWGWDIGDNLWAGGPPNGIYRGYFSPNGILRFPQNPWDNWGETPKCGRGTQKFVGAGIFFNPAEKNISGGVNPPRQMGIYNRPFEKNNKTGRL